LQEFNHVLWEELKQGLTGIQKLLPLCNSTLICNSAFWKLMNSVVQHKAIDTFPKTYIVNEFEELLEVQELL
jgi:hypothetical protein